MADEADLAYEWEQTSLAAVLSRRVRYHGESARYCEECGEEIPEPRRLGVPGVQTCVFCQALREREARRAPEG